MSKISIVINTLNEEKNLSRAIASVKSLADEIVVVDMESGDNTVEIAKKLGAKVYSHKKTGYVEPARNFAIGKATGEWVLILDADEELPKSLVSKLKEVVKNSKADYFRLPRKNIIFGKWIKHSRWWPDFNIRFFRKGFVSWNEVIHGVPMTQGKGGEIEGKENYAIIHYHYNSLDEYLERLVRYTSIQSKLLMENGYVFSWTDLIKKPLGEFLGRYFAGQGYKDGIHGLALGFLQAFSELVLYLRIWEKQGFREEELSHKEIKNEFGKAMKDVSWWIRKEFSWLKFLRSH